jgi:hypothetical protein
MTCYSLAFVFNLVVTCAVSESCNAFSHPTMVLLILLLHLSLWCLQSGEWLVLGSSRTYTTLVVGWFICPCECLTLRSANLPFLCFLAFEVTTQELFCNFYIRGFNQSSRSFVIIFSFHLSCVCLLRYVSFLNSSNMLIINTQYFTALLCSLNLDVLLYIFSGLCI